MTFSVSLNIVNEKKITDGGDASTRISVYLIRKLTWDFRPVIDSINLSLDWSSEYGQSVVMHWLICVLLKVAQLLVCQSFGWFFRKTLFSGLVSSQVPFFYIITTVLECLYIFCRRIFVCFGCRSRMSYIYICSLYLSGPRITSGYVNPVISSVSKYLKVFCISKYLWDLFVLYLNAKLHKNRLRSLRFLSRACLLWKGPCFGTLGFNWS